MSRSQNIRLIRLADGVPGLMGRGEPPPFGSKVRCVDRFGQFSFTLMGRVLCVFRGEWQACIGLPTSVGHAKKPRGRAPTWQPPGAPVKRATVLTECPDDGLEVLPDWQPSAARQNH